ncbi:MAG: type II toxin-antitoxin system VapC family toxin [Spirochaetia bacterium]
MIYLDTSAFIKLYLYEQGSAEVHSIVTTQEDPLPVTHLTEIEFTNALRFKIFISEMTPRDVDRLISLFRDRKRSGQYFVPPVDPVALYELSLQMTEKTPAIGCRALDILHVASARLCEASSFVTADQRQADLAEAEGWTVKFIS